MKKSQLAEFIGILLLVLIVIVFALFNKISSSESAIQKAQSLSSGFEKKHLWTGVNTFLITTTRGIMMVELLGYYECYSNPIISFEDNRNINISKIIYPTLDTYYGQNHWAIELTYDDTKCINYYGYSNDSCSLPINRDVKSYDFFYPRPCNISMGHGRIYII